MGQCPKRASIVNGEMNLRYQIVTSTGPGALPRAIEIHVMQVHSPDAGPERANPRVRPVTHRINGR